MQFDDLSGKKEDRYAHLASVGQIAAGIAHEVRNPLTAVKGFLQLLREQSPHAYIDIAQQELEGAISTLQNLLNVSKPDLEDEAVTKFALCSELESILNLFQDQIYRVKVEKQFEDADIEITGKKNQVKKAFFNLLKNAFEAIQGNGAIRIRHYLKNNTICVEISDTGIGIPQEKIDLLGTPFFTTKPEGTGMGLAYVFNTVYQHGGRVDVESEPGRGTSFILHFPLEASGHQSIAVLDLQFKEGLPLKEFLQLNKEEFEHRLLNETVNKDILDVIVKVGNIDLINNTHKLVELMVDNKNWELIQFAQQEGELWSKHSSLNLAIKLEWFQSIRRVLWDFLYNFERLSDHMAGRDEFFTLEKRINLALDTFLRHFFISFTSYKDELIKLHKETIDDLSVPIVPLTATVSILPLLGTVDARRAEVMHEKVLQEIGKLQVRILLIDMSRIVQLDPSSMDQMFRMIEGIGFMGCKAIVTGIRPEIAKILVNQGISLKGRITAKGSLQQALAELGLTMSQD